MKKILLLLLFYLNSISSQEIKPTYPNFSNQTLKEVLKNKNWKPLIKSEGFLNADKKIDVALILESKDSIIEKRIDSKPQKNISRILLVFINDKLIVQNNTFLARSNEGGMASYIEPEINIKNHQLKIYYEYTRSNISYIFEYIRGHLKLTKAVSNYVQSATGNYEFLNYNFKKKILIIKTGTISKKGETIKKTPLKLTKALKNLSELTEMYEWEVVKNRYL